MTGTQEAGNGPENLHEPSNAALYGLSKHFAFDFRFWHFICECGTGPWNCIRFITTIFQEDHLEGKAFPPRLLRGALPLPAGAPRNAPCPGCPPIPGLATSSHGGLARFVPHTGGGLLAARDVRSTVLPLPVERQRRHEMPTAAVPPCGHPGGISSLPVVRVPASLALPPCGAPVSDRGMCHSAQKFKGSLACAGCERRPTSPCSLPCSADRASPPLILCFMHCGSFNPSFCFGF